MTKTTWTSINPNDFKCDIVCNGFSMKAVILDVLKHPRWPIFYKDVTNQDLDDLAEDLKEAFAIKLRLKEG